jgi:hypothetical protein
MELVVQITLSPLYQAPEQLSIPNTLSSNRRKDGRTTDWGKLFLFDLLLDLFFFFLLLF